MYIEYGSEKCFGIAKIVTMSRYEIDRLYFDNDPNVYIISIKTPSDPTSPVFNDIDPTHVLRLIFDDAVLTPYNKIHKKLFTYEMAERVVDFIMQSGYTNDNNKIIICHCDAGISRSVAIAAVIAKYFNGDDSNFFNEVEDRDPNEHVYQLMWRAINDLYKPNLSNRTR